MNKQNGRKATKSEQIEYLKGKLNRPIRVCGMVKNEGEPGGGPYLIVNNDGSYGTGGSQAAGTPGRRQSGGGFPAHRGGCLAVCGDRRPGGRSGGL